MSVFPPGEELLEAVRREGWTARRQQAFLNEYGRLLRRALLRELGKRFGSDALRGLSGYLRALQQGASPSTPELSGQLLDLAQDTWQAVCLEIFKAERNTIMQYAEHRQKRQREGRPDIKFTTYLWGLVNLKLRQQIPKHRDIFDPVYSASKNEPDDPSEAWEDRLQGIEEAEVEQVALADAADPYWDGLLRCEEPDPGEAEGDLDLQHRREHLACWACCSLKRRLKGRQRDNLLAYVAFLASQRGPQRDEATLLPEWPELSLETVAGRYLRWEEDVCKGMVGKSMRQDRIEEQIVEEVEASSHRDAAA